MKGFIFFVILLILPLWARTERFAELAKSFHHKEVDGQVLVLNGVGIHRRFIFDVYQLALYTKIPTQDPTEIFNTKELMYAEMRFLRDLKSEEIREGFLETFALNCLMDCDELKPKMEELLSSIPDMANGETIDFIFYPEKILISNSYGIKLNFIGSKFGHFFLRAWLGDTPPSERFKNELLNKEQ